jgi:uncharacterized protein YjbI with pentapeptide repeats
LIGADLRWASLAGAIIDDSTELDPKWRRVWEIMAKKDTEEDMNGADFSQSFLEEASLIRKILRDADFEGARLARISFRVSNLERANLRSAKLQGADLYRVNLFQAVMDDETEISPKWRLICQLVTHGGVGEDLSGKDLSGAYLDNVDLRKARFIDTDLSGATLKGADLTDAVLDDVNLDDADLTNAKLTPEQFSRVGRAHKTVAPDGRTLV